MVLNDMLEMYNDELNNFDKRSIAIYTRESTKEQAVEGYNLEGQYQKALEYIKYKNWNEDILLYEEAGKSAKTTNRKQLNQLKKDIRNKKIKIIVVYKLDRLTRRLEGLAEIIKLINTYNVQLISLCEDINTHNAMGRFFINLVVMMAEWEEDTISERTNDGLINGANKGNYMIGGKTVFGWERCTINGLKLIKQVPEQAEVLRMMYDYLKKGYSRYSISLIINELPYMKKINKKITDVQVANLLKHIIHTGKFKLKGKTYQMPVDTIFTDEEHEEIINLLKTREKTTKYNYLFSKKIITKNGKYAVNKSTLKKEHPILYYFDNDTNQRINEKDIKNEILDHLQTNAILYKQERNRSYENDIKRLDKRKEKIVMMYRCNKISDETYFNELLRIKEERKIINKKYHEYVQCFHAYFDSLKFDDQLYIIEKNINRIEIDFDKKQIISIT